MGKPLEHDLLCWSKYAPEVADVHGLGGITIGNFPLSNAISPSWDMYAVYSLVKDVWNFNTPIFKRPALS